MNADELNEAREIVKKHAAFVTGEQWDKVVRLVEHQAGVIERHKAQQGRTDKAFDLKSIALAEALDKIAALEAEIEGMK